MKWIAKVHCTFNGRLFYPGDFIEQEAQPNEHFKPDGAGSVVSAEFTPPPAPPAAPPVQPPADPPANAGDFDMKRLDRITKNTMILFATEKGVTVEPAANKATIFAALDAAKIFATKDELANALAALAATE
ncbi:hypothetical protein [Anaeroselena agilis]|uniref:Uncharacterized protein n=1 Tax=Anaeroselena agilis TaxID=3063788 RepID=A0ABU3NZF4_9FIRM|nr:hypothetical protein [Selenomonadales bacterium 4137-cl]